MGRYVLVEDKIINGRGVWRQEGEGDVWVGEAEEKDREGGGGKKLERFLYHAMHKGEDWQSVAWWIGKRETMDEGDAWGWVQVMGTALTPAQAVDTWQVWVEEMSGQGQWEDVLPLHAAVELQDEGGAADDDDDKRAEQTQMEQTQMEWTKGVGAGEAQPLVGRSHAVLGGSTRRRAPK
jgi:hypothetical protein